MIVLRTPKGWTCPKEIDGRRTEGYWRAHQVPMGEMHENPAHVRILEEWMKSYRPAELFDDSGRLRPELAELAPQRHPPHERQPAHQWRLAAARPAAAGFPRLRCRGDRTRRCHGRIHPRHGQVPARCHEAEHGRRGTSGCSVRTRATRTAGRTCSRSPTAPGSRRPSRGTTISRPTGGSWRCSASTSARAGSKVIC